MKQFLFIICISLVVVATAQDIHFSQFNESPLTLNPALTASNVDFRAIINYRNQWRSVTEPYQTYGASVEFKLGLTQWAKVDKGRRTGLFTIAKKNLAFGINFFRDKAGDAAMGTTQVNLSVASHLPLDKYNNLSIGIQGGFAQRSIDYAKIRWDNQYDGTSYNSALQSGEPNSPSNFFYGDYSAGIQWNYGKGEMYIAANNELKANAGFSVYHVSQPTQSFIGENERLFMKFGLNGGLVYGVKNSNVLLAPSFMFLNQGKQQELNIGTMIKYKLESDTKYTGYKQSSAVALGLFFRNKDAIILVTQIENKQYAIGLSYDFNISKLATASNARGGFELTLRYFSRKPYLFQARSRI